MFKLLSVHAFDVVLEINEQNIIVNAPNNYKQFIGHKLEDIQRILMKKPYSFMSIKIKDVEDTNV